MLPQTPRPWVGVSGSSFRWRVTARWNAARERKWRAGRPRFDHSGDRNTGLGCGAGLGITRRWIEGPNGLSGPLIPRQTTSSWLLRSQRPYATQAFQPTPSGRRFRSYNSIILLIPTAFALLYLADPASVQFAVDASTRSLRTFTVGLYLIASYKVFFVLHPKPLKRDGEDGERENDEDIYNEAIETYNEKLSQLHRRVAETLLWLCTKHGGTYNKAAQYVASLSYAVPKEFVETLSVLCDRAPYREYGEIAPVVCEEFDVSAVDDLFLEFDPVPVASASLAQVHTARLASTGERVAVKVQYPMVAQNATVDLWCFSILTSLIPYFLSISPLTWMVREYRSIITTETDFRLEARQCQRAAHDFRERLGKDLWIPRVHMHLCSKRVMTMEFVDGIRLTDAEKVWGCSARERKGFYKVVAEVFAEMIFVHGWVHCDPHPGNLMLRRDPHIDGGYQVVLLDHGFYRDLAPEFRLNFCNLWKALLLSDDSLLSTVSERLNAGAFAKLFPLIFTSRITTRIPLSAKLSSVERRRLFRRHFPDGLQDLTFASMLDQMRHLPRELLLVLRTLNLLQGIQKSLGEGVSENHMVRFKANAKYAVRGLWINETGGRACLGFWWDWVRVSSRVWVVNGLWVMWNKALAWVSRESHT